MPTSGPDTTTPHTDAGSLHAPIGSASNTDTDSRHTASGLRKVLGRWDTIALGFGAIIGWSWIALIAETMVRAGSVGAVVATGLAGLMIVAIGLIYGELAAAMPNVGGEHVYSLRALGRRASFICTWALAFAYVAVVGLESVALPDVMKNLFPALGNGPLWSVAGSQVYLDQALIGVGASILVTILNVMGIRLAAIVQLVVVAVIILAGVSLFVGGAVAGSASHASPYMLGLAGMLSASALVPFMMVGFDVIPQAAEEIDLPPRKIGQLIVLSLVLSVFWYMAIEVAVALLLPADARPSGTLATIIAGEAAWGPVGGYMLMIGGFAGIMTSWNAFLIGGSRAIFALAQHKMLPAFFARVHSKYKTPVVAIWLLGLVGVFGPFLGRQSLIWFVNAGSMSLMIAYFIVCWSFLKLRRAEPDMPRPYRAPFGTALGVFGVLASVGMGALYLPGMPAALAWPQEWLLVGVWFLFGGVLYWLSGRQASA